MKDYAKKTLADMLMKYISELAEEDDLKEDDEEDEEDIFKEKPKSKPKIIVKAMKPAKKG
jgi:hypothetical protein